MGQPKWQAAHVRRGFCRQQLAPHRVAAFAVERLPRPQGALGDGDHIAPLNPWSHIQYAVTGINSFGDQANPGQQLTRQEALRLFTRENAWFMKMENKIGSIEVGKLGDLVVLDRDYFEVLAVADATARPAAATPSAPAAPTAIVGRF